MITTNTNGQAISQTFIDALTDDNRVYDAKLLVNGTELECSIDSIDITKGSCGSTYAFSVGSVVGSTLRAQVQELADDVKGQEVEVQIGLQVAEETFEYITVGYFVVSEAPKDVYTTTIIGYGLSITATGKSFTPPATQTLANIATSIATSVSAIAGRTVTVTFGTGITTSAVITESMKGLSVYQALQTLASVCGGFAIDTADGNIKICRFSDTATLARDAESLKSVPVIAEEDFAVDGVLCVVQEETAVTPAVQFPEEPSGMENLVIYNRYATEALYDAFLDTLNGYTYRPAKLTLAYGDPRLEGDDVLQITDVDDSVYIVPCHMITHHYAGGLVTIVESVDATEQENEVSSSARGLTKTISQVVVKAEGARKVAEEAKGIAGNTDQYFWHTETGTDTGAHITEIPKEDFLADPDNGGGNLLARSNGIAVRDGMDELAVFSEFVRIGRDESGYTMLEIDPTDSSGTGITEVFYIKASNDMPVQKVMLDENYTREGTVDKSFSGVYVGNGIGSYSSPLTTTESSATPVTYTISEIDDIEDGEPFTLQLWIVVENYTSSSEGNEAGKSELHTFTKASTGDAQISSNTWTATTPVEQMFFGYLEYTSTLTYDPSTSQVTIELSARVTQASNNRTIILRSSGSNKTEIYGLSYRESEVMIPINQVNGDLYTCASQDVNGDYQPLGRLYVGVDAEAGDADLYDALDALGWAVPPIIV